MTATAKSLPPTASFRTPHPESPASSRSPHTVSSPMLLLTRHLPPHRRRHCHAPPKPPATRTPRSAAHFSSECTTDLTFRRFRSTYVCPTPQNIMGAPDVYTIDSAAPTCA